MRPQKSIEKLSDWHTNKQMNKREKENSLSKDHDVVHFVDKVITNINGMDNDENY